MERFLFQITALAYIHYTDNPMIYLHRGLKNTYAFENTVFQYVGNQCHTLHPNPLIGIFI